MNIAQIKFSWPPYKKSHKEDTQGICLNLEILTSIYQIENVSHLSNFLFHTPKYEFCQ